MNSAYLASGSLVRLYDKTTSELAEMQDAPPLLKATTRPAFGENRDRGGTAPTSLGEPRLLEHKAPAHTEILAVIGAATC